MNKEMGPRIVFVLGLLAITATASFGQESESRLPKNHPQLSPPDNRAKAAELTERLRPSERRDAGQISQKNFIDDFLFSKMEKDGVPYAPLSSDEEFFRRIHIDLTGRIPHDDQLRAFVASSDAGKRDKLVDELLTTHAYKAKWTYFFGDLAKSAANRVGNEGKNIFYRWLYDNIHLDRPYNLMVRDMLTANAASNWYVGPASYVARWVVVGLKCEDTVHEDTSDELAINSAKHFLGIDLNCVSCHDGRKHLEKINVWLTERKRDELYRMGAFFGKTRVLRRVEVATTQDEYSIDDFGPGYDASARTVVRVPRRGPEGQVDPVFMLTGERPDPSKNPREEYARMLTSHPQFARTAVNLLWWEMFGTGIVDPPLDFDLARIDPKNPPPAPWSLQPTHPELLDALAKYFQENNYSLKAVLRLIANSSTYQLSSHYGAEWKAAYAKYFARKFVRRLKAEEIYDSLVHATGLYTEIPIRGTDFRAKYATETRSPEDFKGKGPLLKDANFFLESFGQTNREYSERTNEGDITQAILLMNSPFVLRQVKGSPGSFLAGLLQQTSSDEEKIAALFERFLVRRPTARELAMAKDLVDSKSRKSWEDLQWLLVNKVEFVHNF
jgi:hypothetical protein